MSWEMSVITAHGLRPFNAVFIVLDRNSWHYRRRNSDAPQSPQTQSSGPSLVRCFFRLHFHQNAPYRKGVLFTVVVLVGIRLGIDLIRLAVEPVAGAVAHGAHFVLHTFPVPISCTIQPW